ncbi:M23 family metallopeptidase [Anaeromyxobacter dehalogenans]|uniref:Peptidase M23B n=1 Tax=Anaeromyxobacter dehalogenans (strain 2CP-C) TaxID=290397 RepID=Q2IEZ6_ANADE|nr:M23 family metallopeptidase [Anaeromyxobacter dehalogenans]ABC83153.1 peptidase M23B [Anaeromyxobacter dehalogenans 2CP-C]
MPLAPLLALLAAATPSLTLAPEVARPGDAVLVRVTGAGPEAPRATLGGRPLTFWRAGAEWRALAALPIETPAGDLPAEAEAAGAALRGVLRIVEPGFSSRALTLAPKYVEPPEAVKARIAADRKAFAEAYARPFEPPAFSRPFALPRRAPTSGRYGDQRVLNGEKPSVHYGLDLTGPRGAPVAAANAGRVVLVRDAYLSGRSVVLWHGAGIYTLYFHLDRVDVRAGQVVRRGQRIGRLGSTGRSTGPHLHWSVRVDGLLVDPESLVAIDFARGVAPARAPAPSRAVAAPAAVAAPGAPAAPIAPAAAGAPPALPGAQR